MIARDNYTRELANRAARARLQRVGELPGGGMAIGGREYACRDRVIARRNDRRHDLDNGTLGTLGTIIAIDPGSGSGSGSGSMIIETDTGEARALNASYVAEHLEHAYALTAHGAQGGTFQWAGVIGRRGEFTREWAYTALSRARSDTTISSGHATADADPAFRGQALASRRPRPSSLRRLCDSAPRAGETAKAVVRVAGAARLRSGRSDHALGRRAVIACRRLRSPRGPGRGDRVRNGAITRPRGLPRRNRSSAGHRAHDDRQRYRDAGIGRRSASCLLASTWLLAIRPSLLLATTRVRGTAGSAPLIAESMAPRTGSPSSLVLKQGPAPQSRI